jgi:hypothetical protein
MGNGDATISETMMAQTTIAYLESRYLALEKEIANALHRRGSTDDAAIADLKYRKLIIADELQHNRRLVERFGKVACSAL